MKKYVYLKVPDADNPEFKILEVADMHPQMNLSIPFEDAFNIYSVVLQGPKEGIDFILSKILLSDDELLNLYNPEAPHDQA
jgi:hypothetical protein